MKNQISPIRYPAGSAMSFRWGFDIFQPVGTPQAWIHDWDAPAPGFGVTEEQAVGALSYETLNLGDIRADEIFAAHSLFTKLYWHTTVATVEAISGQEKATAAVAAVGQVVGERTWGLVQKVFGDKVPLEKIAWHQDAMHLLTGTGNKAYAWCDDEKVVVTSTNYFLQPPTGLEATTKYSLGFDDADVEASMTVIPGLLSMRAEIPADSDGSARLMHIWTYDKKVLEAVPAELRARVPASTRAVLEQNGCSL